MKLNHLDLPVTDIGAARSFFERHFGLRCLVQRDDGFALLVDEGGFALTFSLLPAGQAPVYPSGFHIGFNLGSEQEVRAVYDRLLRAGVTVLRPLEGFPGALSFQCQGPAAVVVEVAWRSPA